MITRIAILFIIMIFSTNIKAKNLSLDVFAKEYFVAWNESQKPQASKADLEYYLSFLTEDVAWQHLPYATSDDRVDGGKDKIRQGMMTWLGNHESYKAKLIKIHENKHYILLEFKSEATIKDVKTGEVKQLKKHYVDILELDNDKIAIIRRYDINTN